MAAAKKQFLELTKKIWQVHADHTLTYDEARQITENITGFLQTLNEWEKKEKSKQFS